TVFLLSLCFAFLVHGVVFFFSSRRRHTRFSRDWSSDVCSSDLECADAFIKRASTYSPNPENVKRYEELFQVYKSVYAQTKPLNEIGRASCRERVEIPVVAGSVQGTVMREPGQSCDRRPLLEHRR